MGSYFTTIDFIVNRMKAYRLGLPLGGSRTSLPVPGFHLGGTVGVTMRIGASIFKKNNKDD